MAAMLIISLGLNIVMYAGIRAMVRNVNAALALAEEILDDLDTEREKRKALLRDIRRRAI